MLSVNLGRDLNPRADKEPLQRPPPEGAEGAEPPSPLRDSEGQTLGNRGDKTEQEGKRGDNTMPGFPSPRKLGHGFPFQVFIFKSVF